MVIFKMNKITMKNTLVTKLTCIYGRINVGRRLSSLTENQLNEGTVASEEFGHIPVMMDEVLTALKPENNQVFIDMTFGAGGHSRGLLKAASIKLYCLDRDSVAYGRAMKLEKEYKGSVVPLLGRFSEIESLLDKARVGKNTVDGILIDAGCSSMQMDDPMRGFSISKNGPLDMRMDGDRYHDQPTASDVVNSLDVVSLAKIFKAYGDEKQSKKISQGLFDSRYLLKSIKTTHELADLVENVVIGHRFDKLNRPAHAATKIFQALRIFVNNELNELNYGMEMAYSYLKPGGKLAALSFHSLEDRIIKRQLLGIDMYEPVSKSLSQKYSNAAVWHFQEDVNNIYSNHWKPMYKHVIVPTSEEISLNPRSRSAKLRAAVKNSDRS